MTSDSGTPKMRRARRRPRLDLADRAAIHRVRAGLRSAVILAVAACVLLLGLSAMTHLGVALGSSQEMLWRLGLGQIIALAIVVATVGDVLRRANIVCDSAQLIDLDQ